MKKKILLLTLVHPDFLPPVYAVAQVLRDLGLDIHIITFDSYVPAQLDIGENICIEPLGKHYDSDALDRIKFRNKFLDRAKEIVKEKPIAIISFCPFSFQCGLKVKKNIPLIYIALEVADFVLFNFFKSPLSYYRNLRAFKNMHRADLVATPSVQRSAWLAGRCHLNVMPYTVLNTAYLKKEENNSDDIFKELVPSDLLDKKIILYTGAVNSDQCTMELVRAFEMVNDPESALIITGIKDDEYGDDIKKYITKCKSEKRIKIFPYITRMQMLALQSHAHVGACLVKESQNNVKSKMMAPNKIGEYMSKNLYILGITTEYLKPFQIRGFASLADSSTPRDISKAIRESLKAVAEKEYKRKIEQFVKDEFCMQQQLQPVVRFINEVVSMA